MADNEVIRAIRERRSVRRFKDEPVPDELVEQVMEAALWAPSGLSRQAQLVVAVTDEALRGELSRMNAEVMGRDTSISPVVHSFQTFAPITIAAQGEKVGESL